MAISERKNEWPNLIKRCLQHRVRSEKFEALAEDLYKKNPIPGRQLAQLLFTPGPGATTALDPLIVVYFERLLATNKLDSSDPLSVLFIRSRNRQLKLENITGPIDDYTARQYCSVDLEEIVLNRLIKAFMSGARPKTLAETRKTLSIVSEWMSALAASNTRDSVLHAMSGTIQEVQPYAIVVREALSMLVTAMAENPKVLGVIDKALSKDLKQGLDHSVSQFIQLLSQAQTQTSVLVVPRLQLFYKDHLMSEDAAKDLNDMPLPLETVIDLPIMNTPSGLYLFFNSLLITRPLTDDFMITNYLQNRYKNDFQSVTVDVITAGLDTLSKAMYRGESDDTLFSMRSFLINKIPLLLYSYYASMGSMVPPPMLETYMVAAFNQRDLNAFSSSHGSDVANGNNLLSNVRQQFVYACALQRLIPESSIGSVLGERSASSKPVGPRLAKEALVARCQANPEKAQELLARLESMDGNVGALLDDWKYDEDEEHQPVYDDFAAVLLLVLAFVHRHGLSYLDVGLGSKSFTTQLLEHGHEAPPIDQLSEEQSKHLASWLRGLFDADAIDDAFSACSPQEFYMLVPTLFDQTISACSAGIIGSDTVKNGLEYMLDTFLLPSLVGALTWMTAHAAEPTNDDLDIIMQVFRKLIRHTPTSGDAQAMHSTILSIMSSRLDKCLREIRRRESVRQDIAPLLEVLASHRNFERTASVSITDLESWASPPNSLQDSLTSIIRQFIAWSAEPAMHTSNLDNRQFNASIKLLGAKQVLSAIIEEVKTQTEAGRGSIALDIATALICAPSTENSPIPIQWHGSPISVPVPPRTQLNLREMLKLEFDDAGELMKTNLGAAEAIVRLHRMVENQLMISAVPQMAAPIQDIALMQGMDLNVSDAAAVSALTAAAADQPLEQQFGLTGADMAGIDLSGAMGGEMADAVPGMMRNSVSGMTADTANAGGAGLGLTLDTSADAGIDLGGEGDMSGIMGTDEDNIFAGLEFDNDMDFQL
ncbi:mediator complex subunit [Coniosporium apollinis]|uniref:Mediator of RNA polymerase II transcription subunit 5 n=2 Tax=Coniosporium TaxID=2810619 RepID=A0ABQ9NHM1_9PEZI|nr:mediator complex subunit [Cladosporium sp. JES 115]KAJ9658127.1 mediator complex subunit [Coniosporium apollinis]